jgi:hypothetical protein
LQTITLWIWDRIERWTYKPFQVIVFLNIYHLLKKISTGYARKPDVGLHYTNVKTVRCSCRTQYVASPLSFFCFSVSLNILWQVFHVVLNGKDKIILIGQLKNNLQEVIVLYVTDSIFFGGIEKAMNILSISPTLRQNWNKIRSKVKADIATSYRLNRLNFPVFPVFHSSVFLLLLTSLYINVFTFCITVSHSVFCTTYVLLFTYC